MTIGKKNTSSAAPKQALVVGATSSLAQSICRTLGKRGYHLTLAARDEAEMDILSADLTARYGTPCKTVLFDLMDDDFCAPTLLEQCGDFDCLILTTGDMGSGDHDDLANMVTVTHVNYTLPAEIATVAAAHLANKGGGDIVLVSSVAGDRGRASNYIYGSAKAALSAFASGLRNRYAKAHVHVLTIKPGFIDTPLTWNMDSPLIASRDYVADKIVTAMEKRKDVVYVPFFWRFIMLIICHIPERIFKRLKL